MRLLGILAASTIALGCRSGASSTPGPAPAPAPDATTATPPQDVMIRTRVSTDMFVPQRGEAALRAFVPDVPAEETGGECQLVRTGGSGATIVMAYYPARSTARLQVNVTFDSSGRLVRYSERRGVPHVLRGPLTPAQLDSAVRVAEAANRSTTISLDYAIDQAIATNRGGGRPTSAVIGTVRDMERLVSLGPTVARLERVRKLCGV